MKRIGLLALLLILSVSIVSVSQVNAGTQKVGDVTIYPDKNTDPPMIVNAGDLATFTISVGRTPKSQSTSGSFYATLTITGLPEGLSAAFTPNPVYFSSNDYAVKQTVLKIATGSLSAGTHIDDFTVQVTRNDDPRDFKQVHSRLWINTPPKITGITYDVKPDSLAVGEKLTFHVTAQDDESPPQILSFSLSSISGSNFPTGATINSNGDFSWIPTSLGEYTFNVDVSDGLAKTSQKVTANVPFNVNVGSNIDVGLGQGVELTFGYVSGKGLATSQSSPNVPNNYYPLVGIIGNYYEIEFTGTFSEGVIVAIPYSDSGLNKRQESSLRLYTSEPNQPPLIGDFDGNGVVDVRDQTILTNAINSGSSAHDYIEKYDVNHDGALNQADLEAFKQYLGTSYWVDITISVDTVNNIIYGATTHFSGFGVH